MPWLIPKPHIYLEYVVQVFGVLYEGEKCCQNFWQHEILQVALMKLFRTLRTFSLPCATAVAAAVAASSAVFNEAIRLLFSLVPSTQVWCPVTLLTSLNLLSLTSLPPPLTLLPLQIIRQIKGERNFISTLHFHFISLNVTVHQSAGYLNSKTDREVGSK